MNSHERIADNIFSFQSEVYAQVNAGVVVGPNWAVVIDTLAYPEETLNIREFVEQELNVPVRYVINTHYHADHSWGSCFFPGALVISSALCRKLLEERGKSSLEETRKQNPTLFRQMQIILPHLTFERGELGVQVGKKTLRLLPLPGHSPDGIGVLVEEDRVLFAGDVFMPLPYFVDGNFEEMEASLKYISALGLENIVQGHGDIILRGEIDGAIEENLRYMSRVKKVVSEASNRRFPLDVLRRVTVQSCGKSRVLMGGLAEELHQRNLVGLFRQMFGRSPESFEDAPDDELDDYESDYDDEEELVLDEEDDYSFEEPLSDMEDEDEADLASDH